MENLLFSQLASIFLLCQLSTGLLVSGHWNEANVAANANGNYSNPVQNIISQSQIPENQVIISHSQIPQTRNDILYQQQVAEYNHYVDTLQIANQNALAVCNGRLNVHQDVELVGSVVDFASIFLDKIVPAIENLSGNNITGITGFTNLFHWVDDKFPKFFDFTDDKKIEILGVLSKLDHFNKKGKTLAESLNVFSRILELTAFSIGGWTIFPDWFNSLFDLHYRITGDEHKFNYVNNYGCTIPRILELGGDPLFNMVNDLLVDMTNAIRADANSGSEFNAFVSNWVDSNEFLDWYQ